jgi:hypothetical protein
MMPSYGDWEDLIAKGVPEGDGTAETSLTKASEK